MPDKFTFEIKETIAVLSSKASGWNKELNLVSWNGGEPKFDIREWDADHAKMGKGVTLTEEEAAILVSVLKDRID